MKNYIFWIAMIAVIIAGFVLLTNSKGSQNQNVGQSQILGLESQTHDFGTLSMAKGKVTHDYKLKNDSQTQITIKKIYTSCMCTGALLIKGAKNLGPFGMPGHAPIPSVNENLAAGSEATVQVIFDPAAHGPAGVGKVERVVTLETSEGNVDLSFTAEVTP